MIQREEVWKIGMGASPPNQGFEEDGSWMLELSTLFPEEYSVWG
jgi:hypothetical protein